jgi:hypothetical protein
LEPAIERKARGIEKISLFYRSEHFVIGGNPVSVEVQGVQERLFWFCYEDSLMQFVSEK